MTLPRAVATVAGQQLVTVDVRPDQKVSSAASGGTCAVLWDPVDSGYFWLIERMSVSCTSTSPTTVGVYAGSRLIDGTNTGNFDISDNNSPALVDSTEQLQVIWFGASAGAVGTVAIQYRLMYRGG